MRISDWSSDVCSSDLHGLAACHANLRHGDLAQPSCNAGEEQVPRRMAKGVIDHLEPVKINEKQRRVTARWPCGEKTLYLSTETGPVGEWSHRLIERERLSVFPIGTKLTDKRGRAAWRERSWE